MRREKLLAGFAIGITWGLLIFIAAQGLGILPSLASSGGSVLAVESLELTTTSPGIGYSSVVQNSVTAQALMFPLSASISTTQTVRVAKEKGQDWDDILLLYDSEHEQNFDINFRQLASYYGVGCKQLDLRQTPLTDALLRDAQGQYFRLIGISARTLEVPLLVSSDELALIKQSVQIGGANLLVTELYAEGSVKDYPAVKFLTDDTVLGARMPKDSHADWLISNQAPDLTREFSGQVISCTETTQSDFALILGKPFSTVGIPTMTPLAPVPTPTPVIYVVQAGDTLNAIAMRYGINTQLLQRANAILDPRRLQIGQQLIIPRDWEALTVSIASIDDAGEVYPLFVQYRSGAGSILISAGESYKNLVSSSMRDLYEPCDFSRLVPLMLAFRFALGEEVWHSNYAYANLLLNDAPLRDDYPGLRYAALLVQMKAHNFHTTVAFKPINYDRTDSLVARLFLTNPNYFSLVQHGNNNDGYEFYKYAVSRTDAYPARSLREQKADIIEGLARMEKHRRLTGIPYSRIMIFPWGIAPAATLTWLKVNNFHATINADNVALDSTPGEGFDFDMYQAVMNYGNFASIRCSPVPLAPTGLQFQRLLFDLFVGKPLLLCSSVNQVFAHGMDGFNPIADVINQLPVAVQWRSLDYIVKHLYLEKSNDDGSVDVKWYGRHLIIANSSNEGTIYHFQKEETLNVPITSLTVNGMDFPFRVEDDVLLLDMYLPGKTVAEVVISYGA